MTADPLNIVIVGGGLGGLGAAIALTRKGHKVLVLEGASQLSEVGAGIQIPPNSVLILKEYGLYDQFASKVTRPNFINLLRWETGEVVDATPLHPRMTEMYGNPYWLIHRADYLKILHEKCVQLGVEIRTNSRVEKVDDDTVSVHLVGGQVIPADLIVGADGVKSKVRDTAVVPEETVEPDMSSNCAYRATVPREEMLADPKIAHLMTDINCNCWMGYRRHIMAYPIRNGELYNIVMSHPGRATVGKWSEPGNVDEMRNHYKGWDPVVVQLLTHVKSVLKWVLAEMPILPRWVSKSGRVVLLGDACHAMLPYLAQGAAQALEDGATLAEVLVNCDKGGIPAALQAYEKKRKRRTENIQKGARLNAHIWHMPDGEEQEERDNEMRNAASKRKDQNPNQWSDPTSQKWMFGWNAFKD
uniref:ARAD1C08558p n=1 Tax=Blastobotrys adeninivorans TaxID=409370 RepID=A0A060T0J4_BLAAD